MTNLAEEVTPRPARSRSSWQSLERKNLLAGYAFLAPAILVLGFILLVPFLQAVILSFYEKPIGAPATFTGLKNYVDTLTDAAFWKAGANTFIFVSVSILTKMVIGLAVALALNKEFPGRGIARVIVLLPWALPEVTACLGFIWLLDGNIGALNAILRGFGLIEQNIYYLSDAKLAMPTVIAVNIWRGFPFFTLTLLAALQTIDEQLYEAAELDGASSWNKFTAITLPSLMPVLMVTTLLSTIWTTNSFTTIFILTGGGPSDITTTLPLYTYAEAFKGYANLGRAAAVAVIIMPLIILMITILMRVIRKREEIEA
ncbi:MAG: carbohydrate ABC transporter permease [Cypionkella sp.]